MVKPGLDLILCTFALFRIGAIPVVIDPGMGLAKFLGCVRRTRPQALVGIPLATAVRHAFRLSFASVENTVTVGTKAFSRNIERFRCAATSTQDSIYHAAEDELAAILFTSGSTGPPKGVCYQHQMFDAQVRLIRDKYQIKPGEVDLPMLPVFALFNPALGMTTVVPEMNPSRPATVNPERVVRAIERCGVTSSFGSPVLWHKIGRYCEAHGKQLPTLKRILMAGAPAPPSLLRLYREKLLPNGEVHTPYGATEALPVSTISASQILDNTWQHTENGKGTCVGKPLSENQVKIIQTDECPIEKLEDAQLVPVGEIGEIIVHGPTVTQAYHELPDATAKAKIPDGQGRCWHRMGDAGYFDKEGRLWFCGRLAERVQSQHGTFYTDCIEPLVNTHPKIFRSALIGMGQAPNQHPALVLELHPEHANLDSGAREQLAGEARTLANRHPDNPDIKTVFFCKKFPVDVRHNAKIHRLQLRKQFEK